MSSRCSVASYHTASRRITRYIHPADRLAIWQESRVGRFSLLEAEFTTAQRHWFANHAPQEAWLALDGDAMG